MINQQRNRLRPRILQTFPHLDFNFFLTYPSGRKKKAKKKQMGNDLLIGKQNFDNIDELSEQSRLETFERSVSYYQDGPTESDDVNRVKRGTLW